MGEAEPLEALPLVPLGECFSCLRAFRPPQHEAQHEPNWMMKAMRLNADAIHMKAIMRVPNVALMLNSELCDMNTFLKMENMTVATTEATMVKRAVKKVRRRKGNERRRTKVRRRWGG